MKNREAYDQGVAAAVKMLEGERHPYTEMCHGLAAAMVAAGRSVDKPLDLSHRWHDPLAGSTPEYVVNPEEMIRRMEAMARALAEKGYLYSGGLPYEVRKLVERDFRYDGTFRIDSAASKVRDALSEEWITREASVMIDSEIKRKHPKMRRGTKTYKALYESVEDKAHGIVRQQKVNEAKCALMEAEAWLLEDTEWSGGFAYKRKCVLGHAGYLQTVADDIAALVPESTSIVGLRERAAHVEGLWSEYEAGVLASIQAVRDDVATAEKLCK